MSAQELSKGQEEHIARVASLKKDYCDVFSGIQGGHVLDDLSKHCFSNNTTFSKDGLEMAFREGQRSILLHIQNMQKIDIESTKQLLRKQGEESEQ